MIEDRHTFQYVRILLHPGERGVGSARSVNVSVSEVRLDLKPVILYRRQGHGADRPQNSQN